MRVWWVMGAMGMMACGAACSAPPQGEEVAAEGEALTAPSPDYTFFVVTKAWGGGFRARALDRAPCAPGAWSSTCEVDGVDLGALALSAGDEAAILGGIGDEPTRATLLFVGAIGERTTAFGCERVLRAYEVWRSPVEVRVHERDAWWHVSHGATQALRLNTWTARTVAAVDLSDAPTGDGCMLVPDGTPCTPSVQEIMDDAALPAGIVAAGRMDESGSLHVRQYFAKIGVGALQRKNGYWYCRADQVVCEDGDCAPNEDICSRHRWHGGGLAQIYTRTAAVSAQPWLVTTTQLTAAESDALLHPPL